MRVSVQVDSSVVNVMDVAMRRGTLVEMLRHAADRIEGRDGETTATIQCSDMGPASTIIDWSSSEALAAERADHADS